VDYRRFPLLAAIASVLCFCGADWLQFRGNDANGVAGDVKEPISVAAAKWTTELTGRGASGPIVIGDRIVLTSCSGFEQDRLHVHLFDAATGKQVWERQFWATGRTMCHPKMSVATPTPASDGERIFAFYSSNDVACLDLEGNLLWFRGLTHDYPNASNSLGMASSPIVVGKTLILQVENDTDSFATGLNVETGIAKWKIDRPQSVNWTSPSLFRADDGDDLVLLQSSKGLSAIKPETGMAVWRYSSANSTIPSVVVSENTVFAPSDGLVALQPTAELTSEPKEIWHQAKFKSATPSPLVYEGRVYTVNSSGVVTCGDSQTGEVAWRLRLEGPISATPVAAGGLLYFFNEKGVAQVVEPGLKKGEIIERREFGETILCTPAIAAGALFVRSDAHLWKLTK